MIPLLHISNLNRSYPWSERTIFKNFSFSLQQWEFLFISWKSGTGKTTLTRFITWEITPPVDTTFFHRQDLARLKASELQEYRKKIGIVFQDFKLLERKTVEQNILFPLHLETSDPSALKQALDRVCDLLDIHTILKKYPRQLSGWEKQRAAIARALIRKPEFLIMDEPTWNIDDDASLAILHECFRLNSLWITIVMITHDKSLINYTKKKWRTFRQLML